MRGEKEKQGKNTGARNLLFQYHIVAMYAGEYLVKFSTTFKVARRFWKIWLIAAPLVNLSRCNVWITSYPAIAVTPRFPLNISVARMFHAGLLYCIMEHLKVGENPAQLLMLTATHWH